MTDPPIDDTQAWEPDAPGTNDAKQRAPVHGHTGAVPPDKALSDTRGRSWTDVVQSPDVAAGASSCKGGSLAGYSPYTTFGTPSDPAPASLIDGAPPAFSPSPPPEHSPAASGPSVTAATTVNSSGLACFCAVGIGSPSPAKEG
eukprot:scaffold34218_cov175-Isochrysis_galbana.AAC.1